MLRYRIFYCLQTSLGMLRPKRTNTHNAIILALSILLSGCATAPKATNPNDPYEALNRKVFAFNMAVDDLVFSPAAEVYTTIVPKPLQTRVSNFYDNIGEVPTVLNDVLQAKPVQALADAWRFVINSTVGIFGIFDVASKIGLKRHYEDFGLTLARWGAKKSPYIMLPLLGPSTVRDTLGIPVNYYLLSVYPHINREVRYYLVGLDLIDVRANLLPAHKLIKQAFDPYVFVRNAYFQHRNGLINKDVKKDHDEDIDTIDDHATSEASIGIVGNRAKRKLQQKPQVSTSS